MLEHDLLDREPFCGAERRRPVEVLDPDRVDLVQFVQGLLAEQFLQPAHQIPLARSETDDVRPVLRLDVAAHDPPTAFARHSLPLIAVALLWPARLLVCRRHEMRPLRGCGWRSLDEEGDRVPKGWDGMQGGRSRERRATFMKSLVRPTPAAYNACTMKILSPFQKRCFDLVLLSFVAAILFEAWAIWSFDTLKAWFEWVDSVRATGRAFCLVGFAAITYWLWQKRVVYPAHLKLAHRRPPTVFAAFLAIPIACFIESPTIAGTPLWYVPKRPIHELAGSDVWVLQWLPMSAYLSAALFVGLWKFHLSNVAFFSSATSNPSQRTLSRSILSNADALREWILSDDPVDDPEKDIFERIHLAKRIAKRLQETDQTIGLFGPFGSGKSTVIRLVENEIERTSNPKIRVWMCRASCWGFEDARSALRHILEKAIETLSPHFDAVSISTLPQAYVNAVAEHGLFPEWVVSLLGYENDPEESLESLSKVLGSVGGRLVFAIEDLDRNDAKTKTFDASSIVAMLHCCKREDNISFVLAGQPAADEAMKDAEKLCDYVCVLPRISQPILWQVISTIRNDERKKYGDIDPRHRDDWFCDNNGSISPHPLAHGICRLVDNPRRLKHSIRHTLDTWSRLHGEIDFDEVLVVNIFRYFSPSVFQWILRYKGELRAGSVVGSDQKVREEWSDAIKGSHPADTSYRDLLYSLFPKGKHLLGVGDNNYTIAPQGVGNSAPTDYWERMIAEYVTDHETKDQKVLKAMTAAAALEEVGIQSLADLVESSSKHCAAWRHFIPFKPMPRQSQVDLASELFQIVIRKRRADYANVEAIVVFRDAYFNDSLGKDGMIELTKEVAKTVIPHNIPLWNWFSSTWRASAPSTSSKEAFKDIHASVAEIVGSSFSNSDPRRFLDALGDRFSARDTLFDLIRPRRRANESPAATSYVRLFSTLADVLIGSLSIDVVGMAIQLKPVIRGTEKKSQKDSQDTVIVDMEAVDGLFGSRRDEFLRAFVLAELPESDPDFLDLQAMKDDANRRLAVLNEEKIKAIPAGGESATT